MVALLHGSILNLNNAHHPGLKEWPGGVTAFAQIEVDIGIRLRKTNLQISVPGDNGSGVRLMGIMAPSDDGGYEGGIG
jgi:hypothetical protein